MLCLPRDLELLPRCSLAHMAFWHIAFWHVAFWRAQLVRQVPMGYLEVPAQVFSTFTQSITNDYQAAPFRLQRRAQLVRQVLMGYLEVPASMDQSLSFVVNPVGAELRAEERVWNNGDQRTKLVGFLPTFFPLSLFPSVALKA